VFQNAIAARPGSTDIPDTLFDQGSWVNLWKGGYTNFPSDRKRKKKLGSDTKK